MVILKSQKKAISVATSKKEKSGGNELRCSFFINFRFICPTVGLAIVVRFLKITFFCISKAKRKWRERGS